MQKISIDTNLMLYPMSVVVIGAIVNGQKNYMSAAWISRVNFTPPMIGVAITKTHHTGKGIHQNREFSVNVPSLKHLKMVDYVGMVSGANKDKSQLFESFTAVLPSAPMIATFPLTMECRLVTVVDLPVDEFFIGEIIGIYSDEQFLTNGMPDLQKISPLLVSMPDNNYWGLGEHLGIAWSKDSSEQ